MSWKWGIQVLLFTPSVPLVVPLGKGLAANESSACRRALLLPHMYIYTYIYRLAPLCYAGIQIAALALHELRLNPSLCAVQQLPVAALRQLRLTRTWLDCSCGLDGCTRIASQCRHHAPRHKKAPLESRAAAKKLFPCIGLRGSYSRPTNIG